MKVPTSAGNPANAKYIRPQFLDAKLPPFWPADPPLYYLEQINADDTTTTWKLHEQIKVNGLWCGRIALDITIPATDDTSSTRSNEPETTHQSVSHIGTNGSEIVETYDNHEWLTPYRTTVLPATLP